jgi:hypothetical protein
MTGRPPKPSPQDGGVRRQIEFVELGSQPIVDPPRLGRRPGGGRWSSGVREWWATWQRSPQASQFVDTDWNALRRCAVLLDAFYAEPSSALAGEIRQIEAKLGATVGDRLQLRWRLRGKSVEGEPAPIVEESGAPRRSARSSSDPRQLRVAG